MAGGNAYRPTKCYECGKLPGCFAGPKGCPKCRFRLEGECKYGLFFFRTRDEGHTTIYETVCGDCFIERCTIENSRKHCIDGSHI